MLFRICIAVFLVVGFVCDLDARPRRRRANNNYYNYSYSNVSSSWGGNPSQVAAAKASHSASNGVRGHLGGGFGGANAEGVGFSSYSAQAALNHCCFTGQRALAASSVVRGRDGWYAVKLFW